MFKKLIEVGSKILDVLDDTYVGPIAINPNYECSWDKVIKPIALENDSIFHDIIGYSDIKREFAKALNTSSPVSILLCGPPGCRKSEFLKQIRNHFEEESVFIDGSYGSKAGIFQILYDKRPKYILLDGDRQIIKSRSACIT